MCFLWRYSAHLFFNTFQAQDEMYYKIVNLKHSLKVVVGLRVCNNPIRCNVGRYRVTNRRSELNILFDNSNQFIYQYSNQ